MGAADIGEIVHREPSSEKRGNEGQGLSKPTMRRADEGPEEGSESWPSVSVCVQHRQAVAVRAHSSHFPLEGLKTKGEQTGVLGNLGAEAANRTERCHFWESPTDEGEQNSHPVTQPQALFSVLCCIALLGSS